MQGILLSGGTGSRLAPATLATNKQLLLIYDKPLLYYPLASAILAGVRELVLITSPAALYAHEKLLGDGSKWNIKIKYMTQLKPNGIPEAFVVARDSLDDSREVSLFLGDNILYGNGVGQDLFDTWDKNNACIFGSEVSDPENFGVAVLDKNEKLVDVVEKPSTKVSKVAIPGVYGFPSSVFDYAKNLKPSKRNETEIVDLIRIYLEAGKLNFKNLPRGTAWLDTGSPENMLKAAQFVSAVQNRQGLLVGSPDEAAWRVGLINDKQFLIAIESSKNSEYGKLAASLLG